MSLYELVKGCEVTFHHDPSTVLLCVKVNLEKAATFLTDLLYVYKMRLVMHDVLIIMRSQIINCD